ncbi:MAG: hypothetical protein HZB92_06465 [Euryarchaeota archaeon]|nr:hypothetical protein [Euryarchaeota archaeon]
MKALVVYYTRDGRTKKVAESVAKALDCDIEEIVAGKSYRGIIGWLRAGRGAMKKVTIGINEPKHDPAQYDLVVIGSPIWGGLMSIPVRSYVEKHKAKFKAVAIFVNLGGDNSAPGLKEMGDACGKAPLATMAVSTVETKKGQFSGKVAKFVEEILKGSYA